MQSSSKTTLGIADAAAEDVALPATIGQYRILGLLGEGGMGRVYLAQQTEPVRTVALKVVRALTGSARERLLREIDVLAQLEHPHIARLYAAGEAEIGGMPWPWLALEYVQGIDLIAHADTLALDLRARVDLLVDVCGAVQHAHQRGVIHRDLKPANILVDSSGQVRVLDFGIARLVDDAGPGMTEVGQILGTVPYMSPEQLGGDSRRIDARSDVYALGVLAYQLIAGRLPHPRLTDSTLFAAVDIVRNERPPPLGTLAAHARGDLETVVMKSLETEPARRYASADAFANDLVAAIEHRPVQARAPTAAYLARRFVRRHRALTVAGVATALALVLATVVSLQYAMGEARARAESEARAAETAAVNAFLGTMLSSADPAIARGRELSVTDVVERAELAVGSLAAQPRAQVSVVSTLAATRAGLGQYLPALALIDRALAGAADAGLSPREIAQLLRRRASTLTELARFEEASAAIASARKAEPNPVPVDRLGLDLTSARLHEEAGRAADAGAAYRRVIADAETIAADALDADARAELVDVLDIARGNLSGILRERGEFDEAGALIRASVAARRERFGEDDPRTLAGRHKLASLLLARGDMAAAEAEARETLLGQRRVLGDAHVSTLTSVQTLAAIRLGQGALDEGEQLVREALSGLDQLLGESNAQTLAAMNALAYLLEERQQIDEAEALYRRVLGIAERLGTSHPATFAPRNNLAMLLLANGRAELALIELRTLVAAAAAELGDTHATVAIFRSNEGFCLSTLRRDAEASAVLEASHAQLAASLGPEHARTRTAAQRRADVLARLGDRDGAARLRAQASTP